MDDIEEVFMKWNYIDKKPYDICHMIEEAILVAGIKYPHQFHKRKKQDNQDDIQPHCNAITQELKKTPETHDWMKKHNDSPIILLL
ncbi:hypothetical protein R3W88_001519 [Solanum pinnatisectum]|uniref:Uncharacterized protein n=1 Tax=Solanum pinnatisectum TaxID=50273 RepID=A0AAV9MKF9_9SOLN|nr:hypothetical protein R3W88_001519 [Solanum pinnatisectum]